MAEKTRVNDLGFVEGYDDETGEILWVQKVPKQPTGPVQRGRPRGRPSKKTQVILDGAGHKLTVPRGTNPDEIPHLVWPFSKVTAAHICQKLTEGKTIKEIGLMEGFPPAYVIHGWSRKYPEFKAEIKAAREARAEYFHDEVIETAKNTKEYKNKSDRLKIESYKWAAAVNDPATFANRTKISGDADAPLTIILDTGVPRAIDEPIDVTNLSKALPQGGESE